MSFEPLALEEVVQTWPAALDHLSASSLKMAVRCPEQWRQRYILGRKEPPALAMLVGGADHAAIEASMRQKIDTYLDLPVSEVRSEFLHQLEQRVESLGGIGEVEVRKGSERLQARAKKMAEYDTARSHGQNVVEAYQRQASPFFQPVDVEKRFELEVEDLPVKVIGFIDLLAHETSGPLAAEVPTAAAPLRIIDRKRRARSSPRPEPEWVLQAEIYQLAERAPFDFHISVTTKDPKVLLPSADNELSVKPASQKRSKTLLRQIAASIGFYYMRFGPDAPWPATGKLHPWACGYCGFRPDCWAWK